MIKFAIPGMYELQDLNLRFLELNRTHPEYFYDDVEIEAVYGNPQLCIWDGGRVFSYYKHATLEELQFLFSEYNFNFGKPIRFVFTNTQLEEKHYKDKFCNLLMQLANNGKNQVVVNDDKLLNYLQIHYPNFKYISSTTKCILDKDELKKELNRTDYDMVCLDYNFNKNFTFLESFSPEEKSKTEFLVNPICSPMCPHRKEHYDLNSFSHLSYGRKYGMKHCYINADPFQPHSTAHGNNISYQEIKEIYAPMGFEHFKIEGRTWSPLIAMLTYADYMIKPEYRNYCIANILGDI